VYITVVVPRIVVPPEVNVQPEVNVTVVVPPEVNVTVVVPPEVTATVVVPRISVQHHQKLPLVYPVCAMGCCVRL